MSLRPSLHSFKFKSLLDVFGCGDPAIENAVLRGIRKDYADDMQLRVRASELVRTIIHRGRAASYQREEDEAFQIVIDALARHQPDRVRCTSIFWEQFFAEASAELITSTDPTIKTILHHLIVGRPLIGVLNTSRSAYYAFLYDDQVVRLRDFIRADARLSRAFDVEGAMAWLDATCAAGRDVWCWVS
ncbi:MAG: hypothetical protein NT062_16865 [Proteobacteria bacterium]|nr:hypothetical protein [Pseudomonadota bacterium]